MRRIPITSGLLLCEQVIVEAGTHNVTLVNCFRARMSASFPAEDVSFLAVAFLMDGLGDIPLEVKVHRLDTMDEVYQAARVCRFAAPSQVIRCTVRIHGFPFPVPGEYQVGLLAASTVLAQSRLQLVQMEGSA